MIAAPAETALQSGCSGVWAQGVPASAVWQGTAGSKRKAGRMDRLFLSVVAGERGAEWCTVTGGAQSDPTWRMRRFEAPEENEQPAGIELPGAGFRTRRRWDRYEWWKEAHRHGPLHLRELAAAPTHRRVTRSAATGHVPHRRRGGRPCGMCSRSCERWRTAAVQDGRAVVSELGTVRRSLGQPHPWPPHVSPAVRAGLRDPRLGLGKGFKRPLRLSTRTRQTRQGKTPCHIGEEPCSTQ